MHAMTTLVFWDPSRDLTANVTVTDESVDTSRLHKGVKEAWSARLGGNTPPSADALPGEFYRIVNEVLSRFSVQVGRITVSDTHVLSL